MVPGTDSRDALLAQMRRGALQYCVLALLARQERYAPELVKVLAAKEGLLTSEGTIYPLLSRLRRDGLVDTTWRESAGGPPRRYYRLAPDGRRALDQFTDEWRRFASAVDDLMELRR
jgi:PadR family transcriptional regulator PadR